MNPDSLPANPIPVPKRCEEMLKAVLKLVKRE
jgi:hypothetical protein